MEEEKKDERYYYRERCSGYFQRSFRLPSGVQNDKVDDEFKNGVLTINMPKSEESKQKKIQIKTGGPEFTVTLSPECPIKGKSAGSKEDAP